MYEDDVVVSYELAILAEGIGFKDDCRYSYHTHDENGGGSYSLDSAFEFTGEPTFSWEDMLNAEQNGETTYLAPMQAQLQKWLRKNKGVYVMVELDQTTYPKFAYKIDKFNPGGGFINLISPRSYSDLYSDYDECLGDALLEFLKRC